MVSQDAVYFFVGPPVRDLRGLICDTNDGGRSGLLQNLGMPFTGKVSPDFFSGKKV